MLCSSLGEAVTAVHRAVVLRFKRNFRFFTAICTDDLVHLALLATFAAAAALVFGLAEALQLSLQAVGLQVPEEFLRMTPYLVTVLSMMIVSRRALSPAALAAPYTKEG